MEEEVLKFLFENQDLKYQEFSKRLTTTKYEMIGVKLPIIRDYAKEIYKKYELKYIDNNSNKYFEEIFLEGVLISKIKDKELLFSYLDKYVLKIDNWSLCDTFVGSLKVTNKYLDDMWNYLDKYFYSEEVFKRRFAIIMYLDYYLKDNYIDEVLRRVSLINSKDYYVNIAISWLMATSMVKHRDKTLDLIKSYKLSPWIQNKSIQKIRESFRVSDEDKVLLLKYKL